MRRDRMRVMLVVLTGSIASAACGDEAGIGPPSHASHALVGSYALQATFPWFRPDIRRADSVAVDASLAGTLVVGDTVEQRSGQLFFPDVRLTATLCATRGSCGATESYAAVTSLFGVLDPVTFGFSDVGGARTLHFEGPFVGDSVAGPAYYQLGTTRYEGRFVARRQR